MRIVERRGTYFLISLLLTVPGIIYMIWSVIATGHPLPLSIDYTGGVTWEVRFEEPVQPGDVRQVLIDNGHPDTVATLVEDDRTVQIKTDELAPEEKAVIVAALTAQFGAPEERLYRNIGPSVGQEVSRAAIIAVAIASILILLYLAWSFRQVPHPFRYGTCAVIALVHDVLVTISFICLMNIFFGWEIDALFLTAILTVIGYSVSDSIVVFDRIRENLKRHRSESFATISNRSIIETASRSLGTQVATLLTMVSILMLGGPTLQKFIAIMVVGIVSGTYSSIFNAAALLVAWDERSLLYRANGAKKVSATPATA
ncbi:MAG: protein translocase subunit SecF [Caldilineaceae bacterium]